MCVCVHVWTYRFCYETEFMVEIFWIGDSHEKNLQKLLASQNKFRYAFYFILFKYSLWNAWFLTYTKIICLMCGNHIQKIPFSESIANSVYVWWFMPARCWNERVNANISYNHKLTIPGKPKIIEKIKQNKTVVSVLLRKSCCCWINNT